MNPYREWLGYQIENVFGYPRGIGWIQGGDAGEKDQCDHPML